jgi:mono/diheme cytochrome c family protein
MTGFAKLHGRSAKAALTVLGASVLAVPLASAWAVAQDPTQPAAEAAPADAAGADAGAAAAPAADAGATLTAEQVAASRDIFNNFSCGACHVLGDAGATGQIGPSLDGNANLDHEFTVNRVTHGQGAMPGFGGQIADEDIDMLATYIMQVKK